MTIIKSIFILGVIAGLGSFIACLLDMDITQYALTLLSLLLLSISDIRSARDTDGSKIER